ncbi:MAG TPA: DUF1206 domain-containing protein [Thermoanaerobaculia bacterium]
MARTTSTSGSTLEESARQAGQAVRGASRPWVEKLARFGYAARGVVYAVVGILAIQTAFSGRGGQTTGAEGAIRTIAEQSRILLVLMAIGLIGYALWRFVQAFLDPEGLGRDAKGMAKRGAMLASGLVYGGLALTAFRLIAGSGDAAGSGQGGNQALTASILDKPFGRWLVALAGIAVIASALHQIWSAYTKRFERKLNTAEMNEQERRMALRTGQLGLSARGIAFLITGWFLVQAALKYDPSQARGLGGALETLARQPYGPWLLGLVALGLIAFGAYSFLEARYRRIVF